MCISAKLGTNAKKIIRNSNKKNVVKPINITSNMQKNITQYSKDDTSKENIRYIDEPDNGKVFLVTFVVLTHTHTKYIN